MCVPFSLKIIKGILPYSSVILIQERSFPIFYSPILIFVMIIRLTVDGRSFELSIILDD